MLTDSDGAGTVRWGRSVAIEGFILTGDSRTTDGRTMLSLEGRLEDGRRFLWKVSDPRPVFFIPRDTPEQATGGIRRPVQLHDLRGAPVDALYFTSDFARDRARRDFEARGRRTLEADVATLPRYLMERFVRGSVRFEAEESPTAETDVRAQDADTERAPAAASPVVFTDGRVASGSFTPQLRLLSLDIECSDGPELYSIALYGSDVARVFIVDPAGRVSAGHPQFTAVRDESELLRSFFAAVAAYDPDALIGWNVVGFDLVRLEKRARELGLEFALGASGPGEIVRPASTRLFARLPGIAVLDGIDMLRGAFVILDDYSLETAATTLLGRGKLIASPAQDKLEEIKRLFREDPVALAEYNLEDTRLVYEIFQKLQLSELAVRRAQLTGLPVDRTGGSAAAFDFLYLPRLHRRGFVADTLGRPTETEAVPGGLVLESTPGFHRNILVLDFKSLYPSIMLTFSVDPLAAQILQNDLPAKVQGLETGRIVRGPAGLPFASEHAVLPEILEELWTERDRAKRVRDATLSQAVKIIMNSFYGVLGSPGCRFFDPQLAGSITRIGHWILTHSRDFVTGLGHEVIYGDTDSLFVSPGRDDPEEARRIGHELVERLNTHLAETLRAEFAVESRFVIEFEKLYARFFLPTMRGDEAGARKRYAGLLLRQDGSTELSFAGMETSRRDWTRLARRLQTELFDLVFRRFDEPSLLDEAEALVRSFHARLFAGELDDLLVYRKGLSKPLSEYEGSLPPHVRAAALLGDPTVRVVRYVMTTEGPEPIQKRSHARADYKHYSDRQLAPIADMILRVFGSSYDEITGTGKQLSLF